MRSQPGPSVPPRDSRRDQTTPAILPVFPLTGVLLLPGNYLPLNIFEPRYRRMVRDALAGERIIGMVQPVDPMPDNSGPPDGAVEKPELYRVGCAGRIEECERQPDGRFLIVLRGVTRFRIQREVDVDRMYRCVRVAYDEFLDDLLETSGSIDIGLLLSAVERFGQRHGLEFDLDLLRTLRGATLLNALCAALPLAPVEKQALLEASPLRRRQTVLVELMEMGSTETPRDQSFSPPTIH